MKEKIQVGEIGGIYTFIFEGDPVFCFVFLIRVHPSESVVPNPKRPKNRGERSIPGCGAGMETLCRVA
jgi:hypothetical protein